VHPDPIVPPAPQRPRRRLRTVIGVLALGLATLGPVVAPSLGASGDTAAARKARWAEARAANPLLTRPLFVETGGPARRQAQAWRRTRPADAARIRMIADQPQALWLGEWQHDVRRTVARRMAAARHTASAPVFVAYFIPHRDCGQHSSGGAATAGAYRSWIARLARGIGSAPAVVVLEPDALAGMGCLSRSQRRERVDLIAWSVDRLSHLPETAVYIDAGNPGWVRPRVMAGRLRSAGIAGARGFAVNVSGFQPTARARAYGHAVSRFTHGAHFVVDTSRNGRGPAPGGQWCNPPGRGLGALPTTATGDPLVDAFLWIKRPGESDGICNGGPAAGRWWGDYALGLAERAIGG
jgi:endoglucanase